MHLTVYRDETGFTALRGEWNALLARSRFDTLFLTWEWQSTWWTYLGSGNLWLLAWRDDLGTLVGIAPLYLETTDSGERQLTVVGCLEVSDYLDVIVAADGEPEVYAAFLDWLGSQDAPPWDVLDLCNLPASSQSHRLLPELARARGYAVTTFEEDVCPIIDLPDSWEAYLALLDKKQRHEVRRKLRRAEAAGQVSWYIVDHTRDLQAEMDDFIELHRLSQPEKDQFMEPQMQRFFHAAARVALDAGWLQLSFLEVNGEKAAAMLCFDYANNILVYNSGYDPQRYSALSPGIVLLAYCIRHAIELGRAQFDFLQGDEVYKYRFGARQTKIYRTLITRPGAS
ncbi:MAG: GNAT family N-acetyltransferase [Anaerolineae bacterium]|nr:GNAT family N-acetyltransferase [Anaerolineae bacterium]